METAIRRGTQQVVHREPRAEERADPPAAIHREQERFEPNEMRRKLQQQGAFAKRLADKADLELLKVAEAAVDEARRAAARADGDVVALNQGRPEPSTRSVKQRPAPGDTPTHDKKVPALTSKGI